MLLLLYVDDTLIFTIDQATMDTLKRELHSMYKMTEAGTPKLFLGIELEHEPNEIRIHQRRYINSILKCFGMESCKPVATPLPPHAKLSRDTNEEPLDTEERAAYKSLVGTLIYLMVCSRPDLAYAMSVLSKYLDKPTRDHLRAAKHVLRYLRGTSDLVLVYKRGNNTLIGYSDADWAGDLDERRSTSGYLFTLNGTAISWRSKLQDTVALSTVEAEYIAMSEAAKESIWLQGLLKEVRESGIYGEISGEDAAQTLHTDNQGAMALAENPQHHQRSKHIDIRYHFIRQQIREGRINLHYLPTAQMTADVMTKALPREPHQRHTSAMGLATIRDV
jgi:hypothetical protein